MSSQTRKMLEEFSQMFESQTGTAGHEEDFSEWASKSIAVSSITKIPGDASTRRYYRVTARPGSPVSSFILARVEPFAEQKDSYPFLVVRDLLEKSGVDVPRVYDADAEKGLV